MRLLTILVALAATAAAAAPALAASGSFEVPLLADGTLPELAGPVPAGDAVAFAAGSAGSGWSIGVGAPGGGARELQAFAPLRGSSLVLHASPTRLAVSRHAEYCTDCRYMNYVVTLDALLAGPLGGPLTTLARCERGSCADSGCAAGRPRYRASLAGDLLATHDGCSRTASVLDLATGAGRPLGQADAAVAGGRFVAVAVPGSPGASQSTVVVREAQSGAEVYTAGLPMTITLSQLLGVPAPQMALLADATVVYITVVGGKLALIAASPQAPAGRVVRPVTAGTSLLGAGPAGVLLLSAPDSRLELVALDGTAALPAFQVPDLIGTPGFDGRTIAWARRLCATATITSWRVGEPTPAAADVRCPTPAAVRATARLQRDRRLTLAFDCPATARGGCEATARLTAQRRGRLPRGWHGSTRLYELGRAPVLLDPGERRRVEVVVPPGAARWVRRYAPLRLRIDVTSKREKPAQRPAGDDGTTARTVTLRAAR